MPESSATPQRPLPVGYYLDNFETVLGTVRERYEDLLAPAEREFLVAFEALSIDARRLYVRLLSRKGPIFRRDRLQYQEIAENLACDELEAAALADRAADVELRSILPLLLRAELGAMVAELNPDGVSSQMRKADLIGFLLESVDPEHLRRAVEDRVDLLRLRCLEPVLVFRLLFFGNLSQDWTEFVLRDIGLVRYENYELRRDLRRFPTRQAVDDYLLLKQSRGLVYEYLSAEELEPAVELADWVLERLDQWHGVARRSADRIFGEVGRALERQGEFHTALRFYESAVEVPARERRTRVLAKLGRIAEAIELCEVIGGDPRDESEIVFARRFSHRLRRMRGEPVRPARRRQRPESRRRLAKRDGTVVEQLALESLACEGKQGFFAENWLWKSLFGLAFWDTIFASVAGAFQHPFQFGPLDLSSPSFRTVRSQAVAERLESLRGDPCPGPDLMRTYEAKRGVANRLVSWQDELRPHLELSLARMAGHHLAWVFDRLSRDLRRYRRGFPDLFLARDGEPSFEFIEVKAPGDQLRPEQIAWIDYLNEGGIPASILHIDW